MVDVRLATFKFSQEKAQIVPSRGGERTRLGGIVGFEISEHIASAGSETARVSLKGKGKNVNKCVTL